MSADTKISWCDATWNPLRGCTRVSRGCEHCYAETFAARFAGPGQPYEGLATMVNGHPRWTNRIMLVDKALALPLRWQKPRRIFVNSMSDLFHPDVPVDYIARVFAVMALAPRHTFQVLTKRPERMHAVLTDYRFYRAMLRAADQEFRVTRPKLGDVPISNPGLFGLSNVWLGTSVESNDVAERVEWLTRTPAAVRFVSAEPLLGPLDQVPLEHVDWVITGGESGPHFRPLDLDWVRDIRDRCQRAGVAFFHKQGAGPKPGTLTLLDGREWHEFPQET